MERTNSLITMDEETIKTQKPKCRLYWCLIHRVYRLEIQSVMLVFSSPFVNCWPSTFSLTSPLLTVNVQYLHYRQCVAVGGGWRVLNCVVDHILQEFNTLFLTRFKTYKIATSLQTKTPVQTTFRYSCLYSFFVHAANSLWLLVGCRVQGGLHAF
jgi:hypothetical protein